MKPTMLTLGAMLGSLLLAAPAGAGLRAPTRPGVDAGSSKSYDRASKAALAVIDDNPTEGLALADKAIAADDANPWAYYDKADALGELKQVDKAVTAFEEAERRFSDNDAYGKSIAIYGRANVLDQAGRCAEARQAYDEYARYVRTDDPKSADMAERYAAGCGKLPRLSEATHTG